MNEAFIFGKKIETAGDALRVLIATALPAQAAQLETILRDSHEESTVEIRTSVEAALDALSDGTFDIAFIGADFEGEEGLELIGVGPTIAQKTAIIGVISTHDPDLDAQCIGAGALDCLVLEGLSSSLVWHVVRHAVSRKRFEEKLRANNDQMVRHLIDLRDAKERAEEQGAAFIELAEELSIAKGEIEAALGKAEDNERRYRALSDTSPVGIWQMDLEGNTLYMNDSIKRLVEIPDDMDCLTVTLASVVIEEDAAPMQVALRLWANGTSSDVELRVAGLKSGEQAYLVMSGTGLPATRRDPATILVTAVNVTERKKAEAAMQHMAHHDVLTGLPNRSLFLQRIEFGLSEADRAKSYMGVLFLDLDHFKDVNDTLGHPVGDELLIQVSERLLQCARTSDTVARLGGDEFAILCSNLKSPDQAAELAQRIVETIAKPYSIHGQEIHTATSIGISTFPLDAREPDRLVSFADMALYTAKEQGRSNYKFFDPKMDEVVQRRKALENELRESLTADHFLLNYQPQIDLKTMRVVGAEALIRWHHPVRGMIYPGEFIPVAEKCGLIMPLGQWVIEAAFKQAKIWQDKLSEPFRVSINLSAVQFRQKNLVQRIIEMIEATGVDPTMLEFEITESMLMENTDQAVRAMWGLHELGIGLAIDDFGTGFSSLAYLKKFPVDCLKVDKSFVSDMLDDPDYATITSSIIKLAHSLNLRVVAEGVESQLQADFLQSENCDLVQGYFYGKPVSGTQMEEILTQTTINDGN
jgi:diguanylate cyclase (GGDEF)-like protein/PAS domain S-box-containing protein